LTTTDALLAALRAVLAVGSAATLALWGYVLVLIDRSTRQVPTLRDGLALAALRPPHGAVCVIVPAHNESRVIATIIRSLRAETYPELRVVLALDRCTDDTAALARAAIDGDPRFEVIEIAECPDEWVGKVHALHAGFTRSRNAVAAPYLLFADADTAFSPGCIGAALALTVARGLDFASVHSTLTHDRWFERVVQPAAALELMRQYPLAYANGIGKLRPFANGQFMLFTRAAYDAAGGHASVHDSLIEDMDLARRIAAVGLRGGLFLADGLFHCRMYDEWPQFRRGWKRIFVGAAHRSAHRLRASAWRVRWLGSVLPLATFAALVVGALSIAVDPVRGWTLVALALAAIAVWLYALLSVGAKAHAPPWIAPLHIVGAWLTASLLREAAADLDARTPTQWGGRAYPVRDAGPLRDAARAGRKGDPEPR